MRVIAGVAGGLQLDVPDHTATRPFLEKQRGALFNSLGPRVPDATVLDLYAGSGALGIESLSRGAARAVFVEAGRKALAILRKNLERCRLDQQAEVLPRRVEAALATLPRPFDLIFADPPFAHASQLNERPDMARLIEGVPPLLAEDGRFVFRMELDGDPPHWPGLECLWHRRYGRSLVCQYAVSRARFVPDGH